MLFTDLDANGEGYYMKNENFLMKEVVNSFSKQTGITLLYSNTNLSKKEFDCELEITVPQKGEIKTLKYLVGVKSHINDAVIGNFVIQAKNSVLPAALVTQYVNPKQALKMREINVQFFDTVGNAYLNNNGIYIFVIGNKSPKKKSEKPLGLFRPAGIKLLLAFLIQPGMENFDYRTIAADTGIPRTTVGELIKELEKSGFLRRRRDNRSLINKPDLIRRWVEAYRERFRVKLDIIRFHSTKHTGRWWENIEIADYKAVWGGETGGAILTKHLKPQTATIYADSRLTRFQVINGLVRDEEGEIEILQRFWKFGEVGNVAPPLVVYADLVATADERNLETAKLIYDKYLAPLAEENS